MEDVSLLLNTLFLNERPKFWLQEGGEGCWKLTNVSDKLMLNTYGGYECIEYLKNVSPITGNVSNGV